VLNSTYKDFNITARETAQGRMVALRNSFDDLRTSIGTALLPAFEQIVGVLQRFADFAARNSDVVLGLGTGLGVITGLVIAASVAFKAYTIALGIATAANTAFGASLTATGIGAIVVVIGLLIGGIVVAAQKSEGFRKVLVQALNVLIFGLEATVNSFIVFNNLLLGSFNTLIDGLQLLGVNIKNIAPVGEVSFGRVKLSADKAAEAIQNVGFQSDLAARRLAASNLETGLVSVAQAQEKLAVATRRVNELRAQAVKGGTSIEVLNQALKDQSAAQAVLNTLLGETEKRTGGAAKTTKEAVKPFEEYTKVLKSAQSASDSFVRAQRGVRDTQKSLTKANADLLQAQEALTKAQQAGGEAEIADARRAVAAAERGLTRAKFSQEEAVFAVSRAEKELKETRADSGSTAEDIRRAEIALEEAKLRVLDVADDQVSSTRNLEKAQRDLRIATEGLREGDAELLPFQAAVVAAQEAQARAAEAATDALQAQTEAVADYKEALDELATAILNFPRVAANIGSPGLAPILPTVPTPTPTPAAASTAQGALPVSITVNSSVVNPAQVGQEILDYLKDYERVFGPIQFGSTFL
jgi:hypothetical protein